MATTLKPGGGRGRILTGEPLRLNDDGDTLNVLQLETTDLGLRIEEYAELLRRAQKVRMLGSAALNICLVASGAMSLSIAPALRSVDCAAALLVLSEAGGIATDQQGAALGGLDMALAVRPSVVAAANRALLDRALISPRPPPVG